MVKKINYKINSIKFIIFFLLAGLLLPSCKQKQETSQTASEIQIENVQEEPITTEIKTESTEKRTFRSEHPILFTIIIFSILLTTIIVAFIIKSSLPELSNILNKLFGNLDIIGKLSKLKNK